MRRDRRLPIDRQADRPNRSTSRGIVIERIQFSKGSDLTTGEIVQAYFDYCSEKGWVAFSSKAVERSLPDIMLELFRSALNTHVERNGKRQKGYPNVCFAEVTT